LLLAAAEPHRDSHRRGLSRRLSKYIADTVAACVELWVRRVESESLSADSAVLLPALQDFLGAREIDESRLDSQRSADVLAAPQVVEQLLKADSLRQSSQHSSGSSMEEELISDGVVAASFEWEHLDLETVE
jgi:hypothetical protein